MKTELTDKQREILNFVATTPTATDEQSAQADEKSLLSEPEKPKSRAPRKAAAVLAAGPESANGTK